MERVLGVLAGEPLPGAVLGAWCDSADLVLAADGGADRVLAVGRRPHRVVGDLDSLSESARTIGLDVTHDADQDSLSESARTIGLDVTHDADQDSTDCDKLLRLAESAGAASVTLACVEGGYLDHLLAVLASAARSPLGVRLALSTGVAWVLRGPVSAEIRTRPGRRVSLLPLTRCRGVGLQGVRWTLEGATLDWLGLLSVSNRAESDSVNASIGEGCAVLFAQYEPDEVPFW